MKNVIVNVEKTADGYVVTYSTGTVRTYHGKAPKTVYDWVSKNITAPKKEAERTSKRIEADKAAKNPTNITKIEVTADGRYKVTYFTGRTRTFKKETLPNTAYRFWDFENSYKAA